MKEILDTYIKKLNLTGVFRIRDEHFRYHLLYFNFKLPDNVSIPTNIFRYGYKLAGDEEYKNEDEVLCFLTGCEEYNKTYIKNGLSEYDSDKDEGGVSSWGWGIQPQPQPTNCPDSFYKRIKWDFNVVPKKSTYR